MPTYSYECEVCKKELDIIKSISELNRTERCSSCGLIMMRVISAPQISPSAKPFDSHFNHAFGKVVHSKRQLNDEVRRIRDTTGKNIVEVGTDNLQSIKKSKKKYDNVRLGDFS